MLIFMSLQLDPDGGFRYFEKLHHDVESMESIDSTGHHILDSEGVARQH